jgi:enamine deaminase RidA (YjgF/YER057c/UK114 family)
MLTVLKFPGEEVVTLELVHRPADGPVQIGTGFSHLVVQVDELAATIAALRQHGLQPAIGGRMEKRQINPWTWQERFGFAQAWRVDSAQSVVFVAGQAPISADGEVVAPGDFEAQARRVFENLRTGA